MSYDALEALERIAEAAERFESAWRKGERPRIEDVLGQAPEPHRSELLRALLGIEVEIRGQAGECPCREQYRERFPHDPAVLDDVFPASPQSTTMPSVEGFKILRLLGSGGFSEVW